MVIELADVDSLMRFWVCSITEIGRTFVVTLSCAWPSRRQEIGHVRLDGHESWGNLQQMQWRTNALIFVMHRRHILTHYKAVCKLHNDVWVYLRS